jgi:hypothetical protein
MMKFISILQSKCLQTHHKAAQWSASITSAGIWQKQTDFGTATNTEGTSLTLSGFATFKSVEW